jgi:hypothetical protein
MALVAPNILLEEFITGQKYQNICDVDAELDKQYELSIKKCDRETVTFFTQTHELVNRIPVLRRMKKKFVVVAHNSDGNIRRSPAGRIEDYQWKPEPNIVHWFCQNCDVDDPTVTPLPIALENTYVFPPETKQQYMIDIRKISPKKAIKMFVCYNPGTNPAQREPPLRIFANEPWVTIQEGFNNINLIKRFFDKMATHQFVLCPDGNGSDTVRLWEALYIGCIPIVTPHVFTEYFARYLPILIVKDWNEINLKLLVDTFEIFSERQYDWNMLTISFWKNKIEEVRNGIHA